MDLSQLRSVFSGRLSNDPHEMAPFLSDWRGKWTGRAMAVAQPDSAQGVAAVLRWCDKNLVPVVPQGGNTGLSGGATPDESGQALLLSLGALNKVRGIDVSNNTLDVEAGVTLLQVQEAAAAAGRLFPLSLAAEGSCTIGGNLATNAGGVQVLRYGNARDLCLGLEVVTANGELWDGLRGLRKDNTGYDLRDLFIGSEGTLGIITAATLKLFPLPGAKVVAFAAVTSLGAAVALLEIARSRVGDSLTAFETMNDQSIALVEKHVFSCRLPLGERTPWYVLIEVSDLVSEARASAAIEGLLEYAMEQEIVADAAISTSLAQFDALWALRENISEAQGAEGKTIKHDVSIPISKIASFVDSTSEALKQRFPNCRLVIFGHVGDGNLHFNLSPHEGASDEEQRRDFVTLEEQINLLVHDEVASLGGSVSAEHGLGVLRRDEAARYKSPTEIRLMQAIKDALDPKHLMNPGKLLPPRRLPEHPLSPS